MKDEFDEHYQHCKSRTRECLYCQIYVQFDQYESHIKLCEKLFNDKKSNKNGKAKKDNKTINKLKNKKNRKKSDEIKKTTVKKKVTKRRKRSYSPEKYQFKSKRLRNLKKKNN